MRSNDTQVPRGAAAALDQESPRSFWKGLWSGRFYTWNPQTAVIDPWPPAVFRFCTRREVRGCMLGVVWDGMNSLCTAIERDIPRVSVWLRRDSRLATQDSTNSSSPEFHRAPRRSRLGEIRHIARQWPTASRYSPSAAEGQLIGHGGFPPRRSSHPCPLCPPPTAHRQPCPPCPHSPCSESPGISSRKGCLGLTRSGAWSLHLSPWLVVIFSTHSYAFFFGPNPLFPSSNVSETWADLSDFQLVIYLVWVA
jgi:hypothetical protein